jgi:hypothetical protein
MLARSSRLNYQQQKTVRRDPRAPRSPIPEPPLMVLTKPEFGHDKPQGHRTVKNASAEDVMRSG